MPAVSDTSPISALAILGRLSLMKQQFGDVLIPKGVHRELEQLTDPIARKSIDEASREGWLRIVPCKDKDLVATLALTLDEGEAEAIALSLEYSSCRLMIDEIEGRRVARNLKVPVVGTLGILLKARREGFIASMSEEVRALRQKAGFFISPQLERDFLREAGEI
jgi:predicted nucleic acid-binding protein